MKYIRTKDGRIVDTTKYPEHPASWSVQASDYALTIKESENLEELCDEFVYIENGKPRVLDRVITRTLKEKGIKYAEKIYSQPNWNGLMFGAIWTDKGLIYVAKLNEKGELDLI